MLWAAAGLLALTTPLLADTRMQSLGEPSIKQRVFARHLANAVGVDEEQIAIQTQGLPVLERWTTAVKGQILSRADLSAAVTLLQRARAIWLLGRVRKG